MTYDPESDDLPRADGTPDVNLPSQKIPALPLVTEQLSDAEINRIHLQMSNMEVQMIYSVWPQVRTIGGVCKLIDASIKAVKHQRDLLCLPYGYKGEATRKDIIFPPIDD